MDLSLCCSCCSGNCPPNFLKAMEAEHCHREGHDYKFETLNYTKITTHPSKEWGIVVEKIPCPKEDMRCSRRIPDIKELLKLPLARRSTLYRARSDCCCFVFRSNGKLQSKVAWKLAVLFCTCALTQFSFAVCHLQLGSA